MHEPDPYVDALWIRFEGASIQGDRFVDRSGLLVEFSEHRQVLKIRGVLAFEDRDELGEAAFRAKRVGQNDQNFGPYARGGAGDSQGFF